MNYLNGLPLTPKSPYGNLGNTPENNAYEALFNMQTPTTTGNQMMHPPFYAPSQSFQNQRQALLDNISQGNIYNDLATDLIDEDTPESAFSYAYIPYSSMNHPPMPPRPYGQETLDDTPLETTTAIPTKEYIPYNPDATIAVGAGARVWGDPHFVGSDGDKYDIKGEIGKSYNILSDKNLQLNGKFGDFAGRAGMSIIDELGITMGDDKISFNKAGELTINGEKLTEDKIALDDRIEKKDGKVIVHTDEYDLTLKAVNGKYINVDFASDNAVYDNIKPHGLWGLSVDGDGKKIIGDEGAEAQGGGVIFNPDGTRSIKGDKEAFKAYEVGSIFDTDFTNFNRFK